jgi:hypothetical protein
MTPRTPAILIFAIALSVWASADDPARGPTAAEQLQLLRVNRSLLEDLLDHGLKLSDANTLIDRAEECRRSARTLSESLKWETENQADPNRVAELSDNLAVLVNDGLMPTLAEAETTIPNDSQDYKRLQEVRITADRELRDLEQAIPTVGPLGKSRQVQEARTRLSDVIRKMAK